MREMRCGALRAALAEPVHGTAPTKALAWLLVEHPGPWPAEAEDAAMPAEAASTLAGARKLKMRPQLIRRPHARHSGAHRVYLASYAGARPWLRTAEVADLAEVAAIDLAALARGETVAFGTESTERLLLVCTHGRHDACCAHTGRPVAAALAQRHPDSVWETTHLGGHRFAATFVTLPDGNYFGATTTQDAPGVADAALSGSIALPFHRGRAGLPIAAQAAEWYARREYGVLAMGAVTHHGARPLDETAQVIALTIGGRSLTVTVRRELAACARALSCGATDLERPDTFVLIAIQARAAA